MKKIILTFLSLIVLGGLIAQDNDINPNGYNKFYYENGKLASEGYMKEGKPDGYWKTYYENGNIKSEGNRKKFLLDSIWNFYDENTKLIITIIYKDDKKNGIKTTYREDEKIEENFVDDVKQGITKHFFIDGKIKKTIIFKDGFEHGFAKEYSKEGIVITIIEYKRGFVINREFINRTDKNNLKQGVWKFFFKNGNIHIEGRYRNDKKHGYFKEYSSDGNLLTITKFVNGELQKDVEEIQELDVRTDYYPNGKIKIVASYNEDGQLDGIRREYSPDGKIENSYIFSKGVMVGKGIIDESGKKQGYWKEYYVDTRKLKAEGNYKNSKRLGLWKFYHKNGRLEQTGYFNKRGNYDGTWTWYYESGNLLREESYLNGVPDGLSTEYLDNDSLTIIIQGEYIEGYETGFWFYELTDHREEGNYVDGLRDGLWKYFYPDGRKSFEGRFVEDNPNGKHTYYWNNGNIKDECIYIMGRKHGEWKKYNYNGSLFLIISYKNGIEKKYDGAKIKPEITIEDEL